MSPTPQKHETWQARQAAERRRGRATSKAKTELVKRHHDEYRTLYEDFVAQFEREDAEDGD